MYRQRYPNDPGMHNMGGRHRTHIEPAPTFGGRVCSSLMATVVGVILIPAAVTLLAYNEGRAVTTAKSLDEGLSLVNIIGSSQIVEPHLNGKLVHLSGRVSCDEVVRDPLHGVAVNAISLKRTVEMYQWEETTHRDERELPNGDKEVRTSYSYNQVWRSNLIRSSGFDNSVMYRNPDVMPFESETYKTSKVMVGAFNLSPKLVAEINEYHDLTPTVVPDDLSHVMIHGKYMYYSDDPNYPKVGDVRVAFSYAGLCKDSKLGQAQLVSVMAMQDGFTLTGYQTEAGNVLEMISLSHKFPEEMVSSAHSQNNLMTWLIRGAGLFINFLGFTCLTSLIRTFVSYIPIIRELVYISVTSFNISLSVSLSLVTIALSWIIYRPTMALSIIALAAGFIIIPRLRISSDLPSQGRRFV